MGAQGIIHLTLLDVAPLLNLLIMAPMKAMKAMKSMKAARKSGAVMTKGALITALATEHSMKNKECSSILNSLGDIAAREVKKTGVFTIPGLCRIKTRVKPATKACTREIFGEMRKVKAKPART